MVNRSDIESISQTVTTATLGKSAAMERTPVTERYSSGDEDYSSGHAK